jgi:predicted DNA binding CopG/RHH family protein
MSAASATMGSVMTEKERNSMPIRITLEALEAGKIAAAYQGISLSEYASQVLLEAANRDIEEGHRARSQPRSGRSRRPREE